MIAIAPQFLGAPIADLQRSSLSFHRSVPARPRPQLPRFAASCSGATETFSPAIAAASSLYDVLGLPLGATGDEIKAAYRRLARACHPDVVASDRKGASADEFIKIHAAYSTLSDPDKRADYDRTLLVPLRRRTAVRSASPFAAGGYRRTWETDQCW